MTLRYNVSVKSDIIILDSQSIIASIHCVDNSSVRVTWTDSHPVSLKGRLLVGGPNWGCVDGDGNEPTSFYKRVGLIKKQSFSTSKSLWTEFYTTDSVLEECFNHATAHFKYEPPRGRAVKDGRGKSSTSRRKLLGFWSTLKAGYKYATKKVAKVATTVARVAKTVVRKVKSVAKKVVGASVKKLAEMAAGQRLPWKFEKDKVSQSIKDCVCLLLHTNTFQRCF